MKRPLYFLLLFFILGITSAFAQTVTLTYTAKDAGNHYIQLHKVVITNLTKSWQETIYWPDTTLTMQNGTGIDESVTNNDFALSQNNPNPFSITTDVNLTVEEVGAVMMEISDVNGRVVETQNFASLQPGIHQFRVSLSAAGTYVMTARQNRETSSIKMVCNGGGTSNSIDYLGMVHTITYVLKSNTTNPFNYGDMMEHVGYATINGTYMESLRISHAQGTSQTFVLQFDATQTYDPPIVNTAVVTAITQNTATCGGNVISDGGATVTTRGVCWSTSQNPTTNDSHTTDGGGTGTFTSILTGLTAGSTYYVRAYATNSEGTTYGNEVSFKTDFTCGTSTMTDIDGNTYNTVLIGNQCWMKENLKTTKYADGTYISQDYNWKYPGDNPSNKPTYGLLYNWRAAMYDAPASSNNPSGVQGICPVGWHLPSDAEWTELTDFVSSQNGYQCNSDPSNIAKALASITGWDTSTSICAVGNDTSSNNATGFGAVPAGHGYSSNSLGRYAYFWSSTDHNYYLIWDMATMISGIGTGSGYHYSVRCLRDYGDGGNTVMLPAVTTGAVSSISTISAICGGNVTNGGGATGTVRGVCWSTSQNPTVNENHTIDGTGVGSFTSSITGLNAGTTYYVRAYATNSAGTAYGSVVSFTTVTDGQPCPGAVTVTDTDGNTYNTLLIGGQCWMKENLRTTKFADGTSISQGSTTSTSTAYWYYPDNNSSNKPTYGLLYNWPAAMHGASSSSNSPSGVQGICPVGWHLPSDAEWTQLTNYVSSQSGYQCNGGNAKALASTTGWDTSTSNCTVGYDTNSNNATGFGALPAGWYNGSYSLFGNSAHYWSSTVVFSNQTYFHDLHYNSSSVYRSQGYKDIGLSVRCLKD